MLKQSEIDYINEKYPDYIDEKALRALISNSYCRFMINTDFPPKKKSNLTTEWKNEAYRLKTEYPDLTVEEISTRMILNFNNYFKSTFRQFKIS